MLTDIASDAVRITEVAGKLAGCRRPCCTRIGEKPAGELRKLGIEPVVYQGPIRLIRLKAPGVG